MVSHARVRAVFLAVAVLAAACFPLFADADIIFTNQRSKKASNEVFLRGRYIEVGMHYYGSFGTQNNPGTGFNGNANSPRPWNYGVGFIADYNKDGFSTGSPTSYSGDYFLPGSPLEGWSVEYKTSPSAGDTRYICKGRVGHSGIAPSIIDDTSSEGRLSSVWVGKGGNLKVSKSTSFGVNDLFFVTTVTLKNEGTSKMYEVEYMRNVDPDQEQPWTGVFTTDNWVEYQVFREGESDRSNPDNPNMCLVIAKGTNHPELALGLGSVNPNCRVSHYGFQNNDANVGWTNRDWESFSESSPRRRDEGMNLVMRFAELDAGASVSFAWAYILNAADLLPALGSINDMTIIQPTDTVSGVSAKFSAKTEAPTTKVEFYVSRGATTTKVGTATTPSIADGGSGGGVYEVTFDATAFATADGYTFKAVATMTTGSNIEATKVVKIDNTGPVVRIDMDPPAAGGLYGFNNVVPATASAVHIGGPTPSVVTFFLEVGAASTSLCRDTGAPFNCAIDVSLFPSFTPVTVKAVAMAADGREGVVTLSGMVSEPNLDPTDISLSSTTVPENAAAGVVVGALTTSDPNFADSHVYSVLTSGSPFEIVGTSLAVKAGASINYEATTSIAVRIRTTDSGSATFDKTFTIAVTNVNEPPSSISLSSTSIAESASVNALVGSVSVSDPDSSTFTLTLTSSGGGAFFLSGSSLKVAKALNHEAADVITVTIMATDNGSPAQSYSKNIDITVTDVNERPSLIELSNNKIQENKPADTVVGSFSTQDQDAGDSHSYSLVSDGGGRFKLVGAVLKSKVELNFEVGSAYDVEVRATDSGGLTRQQVFTISVTDVPELPVAEDTTMRVDENRPVGFVVGSIAASESKTELALTFVKNAGASGTNHAHFRVHSCSGTVFVDEDALDFESQSTYTLVVDVTGELTLSVTVTIHLNNVNEPPVLSPVVTSVGESKRAGHVVVSSIAHNDPDAGAVVSYSIEDGNLGGLFRIDSSSGKITVDKNTLNYENLDPDRRFYVLTVAASDGSLRGSTTVTINVLDENEAPQVTPLSLRVAENSPAGTNLSPVLVVFDEDGDDVSFSIVGGNTGTAFGLGTPFSSGGAVDRVQLRVANNVINYEAVPGHRYSLTVRCTDTRGASSDVTVTVDVEDVNEAPSAPTSRSASVQENRAAGTLVLDLAPLASDVDAGTTLSWSVPAGGFGALTSGKFSLDASGKITVISPPSFESKPSYTLTARVTDQGGLYDEVAVTINILDVDEAPRLNDGEARTVNENSPADSDVLSSGQRRDICAFDEDVGETMTYSLSSPSGNFKVTTITTAFGDRCARILTARSIDFETNLPEIATLTVCDNASPALCDSTDVTLTVVDVNETPVLPSRSIGVGENSVAGDLVGDPLVAIDPDKGDRVAFEITSGNTGGVFELSTVSELVTQLRVRSTVVGRLQDQGPRSWPLGIRVTDVAGVTSTATVTVNLVDENDPPVVSPATFSVSETVGTAGSQVNSFVGDVTATDAEGHALSYSITAGNVGGAFKITAAGRILVAKAILDHESANSEYTLTVEARDAPLNPADALTGTAQVTVIVTNVNEAPLLPVPAPASIRESASANEQVGPRIEGTDVDAGDVLTYSFTSANSLFAIDSSTGQVTLKTAGLNYEAKATHTMQVRVTDAAGASATNTFTVNVEDINEPPVISSASRTIPENVNAGFQVGSAVPMADPDALDSHTWTITGGGDGLFAIDSSGQITVSLAAINYEAKSSYPLAVKVVDRAGLTSTATITVGISDVNEAPTFVEASLQTKSVQENSPRDTVVGSAVVATDVDAGQSLTYSFPAGQETFAIDPSSGVVTVRSATLDFETKASYSLAVTVTDSGAPQGAPLSTPATFVVALVDVNEVPSADFDGAVLAIDENSASGTPIGPLPASDVDEGDVLSWSIATPGFDFFTLNADTGILSVRSPLDYETRAAYTFDVTVTDSGGLSATGSVTVRVNDVNERPVISDQTRHVNENTDENGLVGLPIPASDVDFGQLLTFTISSGDDGTFSINPCSGQIEVKTPRLDHESQDTYILEVTVSDDGTPRLSASATITVVIDDVNEAPVVAPAVFTVDENSARLTSVGSPISVADEDDGDSATFAITDGNSRGYFAISSSSGQISVAADNVLDYETEVLYKLTVTATDGGGLKGSADVLVEINDVNEPPVVPNVDRNIPENSPVGTVVGGGAVGYSDVEGDAVSFAITGGSGASLFDINAVTGVLTLRTATLNFEVGPSYTLQVTATDSGVPAASGTGTVTVKINDVNEAPSVPAVTLHVNENSPRGTNVGAAIAGSDPDTFNTLQYTIAAGDPDDIFRITDVEGGQGRGQISLKGPVNHEAKSSYSLTVTARDGMLSGSATITVIIDDVNEAPVVSATTRAVEENAPSGTPVGAPIPAFDVDGDSVSFSITGGDARSKFTVDSATGQLLTNGASLDYEMEPNLQVVVTATDTGGLSGSGLITVQLVNVNEAPVLSDATLSINEKAKLNDVLTGYPRAVDVDSTAFTYTIESAKDVFDINPTTGAIYVASEPVVPAGMVPDASGLLKTVVLTVRVADNGDPAPVLADTAVVTINIFNENDPPYANPFGFSVPENSPVGTTVGTVSFTDPDDHSLTYSLDDIGNGGVFAIDSTSGVITVAKAVLNFEDDGRNSFSLRAIATDNGPGPLRGDTTVTVTVTNVNERPTVVPGSFSVDENVVGGTLLDAFDPETGVPMQPNANANDADLAHGDVLSWSIKSGNVGGVFAIDSETGTISVAEGTPAGAINFEARPSYTLILAATDLGGMTHDAAYSVTIRDRNDRPKIAAQVRSIPENPAAGTTIGVVLSATDADSGSQLTFTVPAGGENCWRMESDGVGSVPDTQYIPIPLQTPGSLAMTFTLTGADWMYLTLTSDPLASGAAVHQVVFGGVGGSLARFIGVRTTTTPGTGAKNPASFADSSASARADFTAAEYAALHPSDVATPFWIRLEGGALTIGSNSVVGEDVLLSYTLPASGSSADDVTHIGYAGLPSVSATTVLDRACFDGAGEVGPDVVDLGSRSGQLSVADHPDGLDFERRAVYSMLVRVTDDGEFNLWDEAVVRVVVTDVNEVPVVRVVCPEDATAAVCLSVEENSGVGTLVGSPVVVDDQESFDTHTFALQASSNARGAFAIHPSTGQITVNKAVLDHEDEGTAGSFRLVVLVTDDGTPAETGEAEIYVEILDVNETPRMPDACDTFPQEVCLSIEENSEGGVLVGEPIVGSDVDDALWGHLEYTITGGAGAHKWVMSPSGQVSVAEGFSLDFETKSVYTLGIRVTDGGGLFADAQMRLSLIDVNEPPFILDAVRHVDENSPFKTFVGEPLIAWDYDFEQNETLRYDIVGGDGAGIFRVDPCSGQLLVNRPTIDYETKDTYTLTVRVTDEGDLYDEATVDIIVDNVNEAPVLPQTEVRQVAENAAVETVVSALPSSTGGDAFVGFDYDTADTLTYSVTGGTGADRFDVDPDTGSIFVIDSNLNFEDDTDNVLTLVITAEDDAATTGQATLSSNATVTIVLLDVNESPEFLMPTRLITVPENSPVSFVFGDAMVGTDPDSHAVDPRWRQLSFSVVGGNGSAVFGVGSSNGRLFVRSAMLDYETADTYTLDIQVADAATPSLTDVGTVYVSLTDVNERPDITDQTRSIAEDAEDGALVDVPLTCSDVDGGQTKAFVILNTDQPDASAFRVVRETGQLTLDAPLDYETQSTYTLTVKCEDGGLPPVLSDQAVITVTVDDVNEAPIMEPTFRLVVPENSPADTQLVREGQAGVFGVWGYDVDAGDELVYELVSGDSSRFKVDGPTGDVLTVAGDNLDFESQAEYTLVISLTDLEGLSATTVVTVTVQDVNEAPILPVGKNLGLFRNSPVGTFVGLVTADDPEGQESQLMYSIVSQSHAGMFRINANTGNVTVAGHRDLLVLGSVFTVRVRVDETATAELLSDEADVSVTITDANFPPFIYPEPRYTIPENSPVGTVIATIPFSDDDSASQTFRFFLNPARWPIRIDWEPTLLRLRVVVDGPLDHETTGEFTVVMNVTDSHEEAPASDAKAFTVEILDVNEPPSIPTSQFLAVDGSAVLRVNENSTGLVGAGTLVGGVTAVDVDDTETEAGSLSFGLGPVDPAAPFPFSIVKTGDRTASIYLTDAAALVPDFETRPQYPAVVSVVDGGDMSATVETVIQVIDRNDPPTLDEHAFSVAENAPAGTVVGTIVGDDVDLPVDLVYEITAGNPGNHFALNPFTGKLTIQAPVDFEMQAEHVLTIRASDKGYNGDSVSLHAEATCTVTVLNVVDVRVESITGAVPHRTIGGEVVVIHGANFGHHPSTGLAPATVSVTYGETGREYTATSCSVNAGGNDAITCRTAPGIGSGLLWTVTITADGIPGDVGVTKPAAATRYQKPSVSGITGGVLELSTQGNDEIVIFGQDLGTIVNDISITYGSADRLYAAHSCEVSNLQDEDPSADPSDQKVVCLSAPGVGADLKWSVSVRGQASDLFSVTDDSGSSTRRRLAPASATSASQYKPPSITAVEPSAATLRTSGEEQVVLLGSDFGVAGLDDFHGLRVTYGPEGDEGRYLARDCAVNPENPHVEVTCLSNTGVGSSHKWRLEVGGQVSEPSTDTTSYTPPTATAVSGQGTRQAKTEGGQRVIVAGDNFGSYADAHDKLLVTYGATGREYTAEGCVIGVDFTSISCVTTEGTGSGHSWIVTIDSQESNLLEANTGYGAPIISFYNGTGTVDGAAECEAGSVECGTTRGMQVVDINGLNFGPASLGNAVDMFYGPNGNELAAVDCYIIEDHVRIRCLTTEGAGRDHVWSVTIDGQESVSPTTSYGAPEVLSVDGPGAMDASTYGGEVVNVRGINFGPPDGSFDYLESVTYGLSGFEYTARDCEVVTHEHIRCLTSPGVGKTLRWVVTVASQQSEPSEFTTSYADPVLLTTNLDSTPLTTQGGYPITFTASNVGAGDPSSEVLVEVSGISANPVRIRPLPLDGVLAGGVLPADEFGKLGQNPDTITFLMPEGRGKGRTMRLVVRRVGVSRGSPEERFSDAVTFGYDDPNIIRLQTRELFPSSLADTEAGAAELFDGTSNTLLDVTLYGVNFGSNPNPSTFSSVVVRTLLQTGVDETFTPIFEEFDVSLFESWDHEQIRFIVPYKGTVKLIITSEGQDDITYIQETNEQNFQFDFPAIAARNGPDGRPLPPPVVASNGTTWVRIEGRNLFVDGEGVQLRVTIGGTNGGMPIPVEDVRNFTLCDPAECLVNQAVEVKVPAWQGASIPLVIFKVFDDGNAPGSEPFLVDVAPPSVSFATSESGRSDFRQPLAALGQVPITARTTGTTHVRFYGQNFGTVNTTIEMLRSTRKFTNCVREHDMIDCVAPAGEGATKDDLTPMEIQVVQPRLQCNVADLADTSDPLRPVWNRCILETDPLISNALRSQPWQFRYERPVVHTATDNVPTVGGAVKLLGVNFGTETADLAAALVHTSDGTRPSIPCNFAGTMAVDGVTGKESLSCMLPPGVGADWKLALSVSQQNLEYDNVTMSYAPPVISSLSNYTGPTSGGYYVTITGDNFGGPAFADFGAVYLDNVNDVGSPSALRVPDEGIVSFSHTHITFEMPASQGPKLVRVRVDGQNSNVVSFVFSPPTVTSMSPDIIPTMGGPVLGDAVGDRIVLTGSSFGLTGAIVEVVFPAISDVYYPNADALNEDDPLGTPVVQTRSLPSVNCTASTTQCVVMSQTHDRIEFRAPPGMGRDVELRVYVQSGGVPAVVPVTSVVSPVVIFHYAPPTITDVVPNVADSRGQLLRIHGDNFGQILLQGSGTTLSGAPVSSRFPYVHLDGRPCTNAKLLQSTDEFDLRPYIECYSGDHVVGRKNVSLSVAFQTTRIDFTNSKVYSECFAGYFGNVTEHCEPCPEGAYCLGARYEPLAQPGWYVMNNTGKAGCMPRHMHREWCPQPLPCEPAEACVGDNVCGVGYRDEAPLYRCSKCADGFYRLAGECEKCPDNPWILIVGFIVVALACAIAGWIMNRKAVNIAFLSIGIDYFQVLAMFARSKVDWPPGLLRFFQILSAFNFNLEITAPECAVPDLDYKLKWVFIESLPLAALSIFLLLHIVQYLKKRIILGRRRKLHSHVPTLVGTSLVMMYYLYLNLTRTILDIFNCQPTNPPTDGKEYLEVVFEECGISGGIQMTLLPWAILALLLYTVGYPAILAVILYKNRMRIMEDQLLRANDSGANRAENPHCYDIRKMFHKMYYHFRPDYFFWILIIIMRKFCIAFTSLMFNRNAAFQMSVALLVLFISYALQVRNTPYMSMSERDDVLADHRRKVAMENPRHLLLASELAKVKSNARKTATIHGWDSQTRAFLTARRATNFFWNYNTVEAVLLFCAVLINLAGVMFESGRFESGLYEDQKNFITWLVVIVIVVSVLYFLIVLFSEMWMMCRSSSKKPLSKADAKKAKRERVQRRLSATPGTEAFNPMFQLSKNGGAAAVTDEEVGAGPAGQADDQTIVVLLSRTEAPKGWQWGVVQSAYQRLLAQNNEMKEELAKYKRQVQTARAMQPSRSNRKLATRPKRHQFSPVLASNPVGTSSPVAAAARARAARGEAGAGAGAGVGLPGSAAGSQ